MRYYIYSRVFKENFIKTVSYSQSNDIKVSQFIKQIQLREQTKKNENLGRN